jgi:hypothetical protein
METEIKKTTSVSAPKEKRPTDKAKSKDKSKSKDKDESKVHKLSLKGSSRLVAEFVRLLSRNPVCSIVPKSQLLIGLFLRPLNSSNTRYIRSCTKTLPLPENEIEPKTNN